MLRHLRQQKARLLQERQPPRAALGEQPSPERQCGVPHLNWQLLQAAAEPFGGCSSCCGIATPQAILPPAEPASQTQELIAGKKQQTKAVSASKDIRPDIQHVPNWQQCHIHLLLTLWVNRHMGADTWGRHWGRHMGQTQGETHGADTWGRHMETHGAHT